MAGIIFSEGSGLTDSVFGKSQAPIQRFLTKRAEAFEQESIAKQIFDMSASRNYAEKLTGLTAMDDFHAVGENGAYPVAGMEEGYSKTLEHTTWKSSFSLSREIMDDGKVIDLRKKPEQFITSYHRTRERFAAALLGTALTLGSSVTFGGKKFSTAGADGKCVFATNHPAKVAKSTHSNVFSNEFSADMLAQVEEKMQNTVGDNGEILDLAPDTIIIPNDYTLKKAVFSAIGADKDPATANNGFNYLFGRWNVIVWPYLNQFVGSAKPWILFDSKYNKEVGTNVWFDRVTLEVRSSIDENTDANVWRGYARFSAGFNDWRGMYAGGVTGGTTLS